MKHGHLITGIKREIGSNVLDYLTLITASVLFLILLQFFSGEKPASYVVLISFVSFYIVWGMVHHMKEKTIHAKNVIEYILLGFGILLLLMMVFSF